MIPDKIYTILKWIAVICIPAVVTFLSVVLGVLDVDPKTINVITTIITALGTLIGTLIGVSTVQYKKGHDIIVQDKEEGSGESK